jgi:hypothetical protein
MHASAASPARSGAAQRSGIGSAADAWLRRTAVAWMAIALGGQWIFAAYVLVFYGSAVLAGDWARWNQVLPRGYVVGDTSGNLVVLSHLAFTVVVVLAGSLQMLPVLRRRWPMLHRISGRTYLVSALVLGLGGLFMALLRGGSDDAVRQVANVLNTLLIVLFATMAWRTALARRFTAHRRWALRLFMAVAGVWFFRVGLMLWLVIHQAPVGFDPETFTGPFLSVLSCAKFLLPLFFLELTFRGIILACHRVVRERRPGIAVHRNGGGHRRRHCDALVAAPAVNAAREYRASCPEL